MKSWSQHQWCQHMHQSFRLRAWLACLGAADPAARQKDDLTGSSMLPLSIRRVRCTLVTGYGHEAGTLFQPTTEGFEDETHQCLMDGHRSARVGAGARCIGIRVLYGSRLFEPMSGNHQRLHCAGPGWRRRHAALRSGVPRLHRGLRTVSPRHSLGRRTADGSALFAPTHAIT